MGVEGCGNGLVVGHLLPCCGGTGGKGALVVGHMYSCLRNQQWVSYFSVLGGERGGCVLKERCCSLVVQDTIVLWYELFMPPTMLVLVLPSTI